MIKVLQFLKQRNPWWLRILIKMVLIRLPFQYGFWQKLRLFRHGYMDNATYAIEVFEHHCKRAGFSYSDLKNKMVLEIGPGDSISTAIIMHALGGKAILVDVGPFATYKPENYLLLCRELALKGLKPLDVKDKTLKEVLEACGAVYYTEGLKSFKAIQSETIDFIFSQAVLEHIKLKDFREVQSECFRILKKGGVASHKVDLKDHLGGGLNNLRFSDDLWESTFFSKSGFYTNRIRISKILDSFSQAQFKIKDVQEIRWKQLPLAKNKMNKKFSNISEKELLVKEFDAFLEK